MYLKEFTKYSSKLIELHKKFGPVMRFDYGLPTVFISDYDLAVEAYTGDALLGRPTKLLPGYAVLRGKVRKAIFKIIMGCKGTVKKERSRLREAVL